MNNYNIKQSNIHGKGVFSTKKIKKNQSIGEVIYYKYYIIPVRTSDIGLYHNHAFDFNCKLIYKNYSYYLYNIKKIEKNTELTINYNDTPWFIAGTWCINNIK